MPRKARSGALADAQLAARVSADDADADANKTEKRTAIRRAAYRCFTKGGYHQTTVDDICEAAGISKGSFYWYYQSKQAIFHSILDTWGANVEAELRRELQSVLAGGDAFAALTAALESELVRNRRIAPVWLEFFTQVQRDPEIRVGLVAFHERIRGAIARLLGDITGHALDGDEAQTAAGLILAAFIGLMCDDLVTADDHAMTARVRATMRIVQSIVADALRARRVAKRARPPVAAKRRKSR
jgi:AcrR family transcriptional regulator